jgi:RimJ/RimL family protein N-acetyltransferase
MRYITGGEPLSADEVGRILDGTKALWTDHGFGPWAAVEKASARWVGRIGLNRLDDWPGPEKWEVGFELAREFWGQGLATEAALEAIRFGFEDVGLERIISVTEASHRASQRVLEKSGLTLQGERQFRGATVVWYAIDR